MNIEQQLYENLNGDVHLSIIALIISVLAIIISSLGIYINLIAKRIEMMNALNDYLNNKNNRDIYDHCLIESETIDNVDHAIFYLDYFVPYYHCLWLISTKRFYDLVGFRFFIVANNAEVRDRVFTIQDSTRHLQDLYQTLDRHLTKKKNWKSPFPHYRTFGNWRKDTK